MWFIQLKCEYLGEYLLRTDGHAMARSVDEAMCFASKSRVEDYIDKNASHIEDDIGDFPTPLCFTKMTNEKCRMLGLL